MKYLQNILESLLKPFDARDLSRVIRNSILLLVILTLGIVLFLELFNSCQFNSMSITFMMVAIACFAFGAAIGFLFGLPKVQKDFKENSKYADNTALEDVSDWFTKIIVGLTLVELKSILSLIDSAAVRIQASMQSCCLGGHCDFYVLAYSEIVLYFLAGGGICYLWTRTNAASIFTSSIVAKKNDEIAGLEDQKRTLMKTAQESVKVEPPTGAAEKYKMTADLNQPSPEFAKEILSVYSSKKVYDTSDLQSGRWGGVNRVGDFILEARYDASRNVGSLYGLTLTVKSLSKSDWAGEVAFFVHDTFASEILYAKAINGVAQVDLVAFEAFVVGARTSEKIDLELDLNKTPGFPKDFYWS